jgi:hypothetical protein
MDLVSDQVENSVESFGSECLGGSETSQRCADNGD